MSKSLGNFFTVRDLLNQGVPGEVIRFVMLSTHYRKPMDWTEKKREEAEKTLLSWAQLIDEDRDAVAAGFGEAKTPPEIVAALSEDLNTSGAITELRRFAKEAKHSLAVKLALAKGMGFLGFDYTRDWSAQFGY